MRILQIGTFPYPSTQGSQVYVKGIIEGLAGLGHHVDLLCYGHGVGDLRDIPNVTIYRTPVLFGYSNMRAGPDLVKPILDLLMSLKMRRLSPDIIHVHNYEAPLVAKLAKVLSKKLRGVPMVYSAHNLMGEELGTYFEHGLIQRLAKVLGRGMDSVIPRMASHAIVLRKQSIPKLTSLGCAFVSEVPPSVDAHEFLPLEELRNRCPSVLEEGNWIVYAGNPDAYQNIEVLMQALECLPDIGLVMVSASDTTNWVREKGRVVHVQTKDFTLVQQYIANADLAVIPRMHCTGFPIKLLNYLMLGCVTLVSEGSMVDMVGAVEFPNGDSKVLVEKIQYWITHDHERGLLGEAAVLGVVEGYSHRAQAEKLVNIYTSLLKT